MTLPTIFSSTALRNDQTAVRRAADSAPVYVTESGGQSYVFCTESDYEKIMSDEEEQALYHARVARLVSRGRNNIASGNCVKGLDAAREYVRQARQSNG